MNKLMTANSKEAPVLQVTVAGGGPVGLSFALLLESLMGNRVAVKVYESRWIQEGSKIVWKSETHGNARRQQVVTIQSRQYLKLPKAVQKRLFQDGHYTEMWPAGPDSIQGYGPRNIRIARVEDQLLELANEKSATIQLIPTRFDPAANQEEIASQHILAICEGSQSRTREHFIDKFGQADKSMYTLDGAHVQDVVLGLRVKSDLPDPMAVLLTVAQNRFLLNSLNGSGFLNMRLTDDEIREVVGIDLTTREFKDCIQSRPCVMERSEANGEFKCTTHSTIFLPALLRNSALWTRVLEGLKLFGVSETNLSAVTAFRLDMVQRPRFTTQLFPTSATTPGTFGFLLGDAANAIHFWPGRGLNSGIASAISLARCLATQWQGRPLRDADFLRHEAVMAMLQYRHKSRAWRAMVTSNGDGRLCAIKDKIKQGIVEGEGGNFNKEAAIDTLLTRLSSIRSRLESRLQGLPDDATLRSHLEKLDGATLHTLVVSDVWDTLNVSGEEVEVDLLLEGANLSILPAEAQSILVQPGALVSTPEADSTTQPPLSNIEFLPAVSALPPVVEPHSSNSHQPTHGLNNAMTIVSPLPANNVTFIGQQPQQPVIGTFVRVSSHPTLPSEWPVYDLTAMQNELRQIHIGRHHQNNTVVLCEPSISREHAVLVQREGRLYLRDRSRSGTFLNGKRLESGEELLLRHKDLVCFGTVTYEFQAAVQAETH